MATKKVLVTGGSGFIGSALVKSLLEQGHSLRVIDDNSRGAVRRLESVWSDIEFVDGDIRDAQAVEKACRGMDCVCHLAYINGTEYFYSKPALVLEVGVKGMLNVLDGCESAQVPELLLMSSSEVYQTPPASMIPTPETVPLIVPDPLEARYSYGGGKIISELLALNYGRTRYQRVLVVRPHNVYGPDMGEQHAIPQMVSRMFALGQATQSSPLPFPIQGTGQETRSFVYIDDFLEGMRYVLESGEHLNIYHVGTDVESPIGEVAQQIARALGFQIELQTGDLLPGSTLRRCPDISKVARLGYQPKISLQDGIGRYVEWFLSHKQRNGEHE
ncbi:SDR family NAD(P)-dependent oxidoreductase [bacterium]|nr:SDR family NAD(P)-dependent oxidoreductase [bacterium]